MRRCRACLPAAGMRDGVEGEGALEMGLRMAAAVAPCSQGQFVRGATWVHAAANSGVAGLCTASWPVIRIDEGTTVWSCVCPPRRAEKAA